MVLHRLLRIYEMKMTFAFQARQKVILFAALLVTVPRDVGRERNQNLGVCPWKMLKFSN